VPDCLEHLLSRQRKVRDSLVQIGEFLRTGFAAERAHGLNAARPYPKGDDGTVDDYQTGVAWPPTRTGILHDGLQDPLVGGRATPPPFGGHSNNPAERGQEHFVGETSFHQFARVRVAKKDENVKPRFGSKKGNQFP